MLSEIIAYVEHFSQYIRNNKQMKEICTILSHELYSEAFKRQIYWLTCVYISYDIYHT